MKRRISCAVFIFLFSSFAVFADFSVVSPVPGTWANKQVLLLSLENGQEAYYSINGTDPLVSGFAYDGPVTIDVAGNVEIRIMAVSSDGQKTSKNVSYTVAERSPEDEKAQVFLRAFTSVPVYEYIPGNEIEIPSAFYFSTGTGNPVFIPARTVSLAKDCCTVSFIPFILTDGTSFWRTVISTKPSYGVVARRSVPFTVENWTKISFTDKKLIYSIDGGWWQSSSKPFEIDRTVPHTLRWQPSSFEKGNPVQVFELPSKPSLLKEVRPDHSVLYTLSGSQSYKIGASDSEKNALAAGSFSSMGFDVFAGDCVEQSVCFALYSDNVYQGTLSDTYRIDRRPPSAPLLIPSEKGSFTRNAVDIQIVTDKDSDLYCSYAMPAELNGGFESDESDTSYTEYPFGRYEKMGQSTLHISADSEKAAYYKVSVYAEDKAGNKSIPSVYGVVIDPCNYYFDASADSSVADGSRNHPFTEFKKDFFPDSPLKFVHFHIRGTVVMPDDQFNLQTNCKITGSDNALLSFQKNSSLLLRLVSLEIDNCLINKIPSAGGSSANESLALFELENAILSINGSEIVSQFDGSGTIIKGTSSAVMIKNSGLINQSASYASIISGFDTRVQALNCRVSSIAQTAVNFSLHGGSLELRSSACKVVGSIGRIAELLGSELSAAQNTFTGELNSPRNESAVWKDSAAVVFENTQNTVQGF